MRTSSMTSRVRNIARTVALGAAAVATIAIATPSQSGAQALGPQRQFLSLEPYYARLQLDPGLSGISQNGVNGGSRTGVNGYGGRLWVNLAPFSGPSPNLLGHMSLALFTTYYPSKGIDSTSILHYGAEADIFFVNRPLGGFLDPFISVGGGAFRLKDTATQATDTRFALSPGVGLRIPLSNRFQLRGDAKDLVLFKVPDFNGSKQTLNNYEFTAALGITF